MKTRIIILLGFSILYNFHGWCQNEQTHRGTGNEKQKEQVRQTLTTLGLEFDEKEVDQMTSGTLRQVNNYQAIRTKAIDNSVRPALVFNPFPIGYQKPQGDISFIPRFPDKLKRPKNDLDLAFMTIPELAFLIKSRQVSSLELTQLFLRRLKSNDSLLHCVVSYTEEYAINKALQADQEIADGNYRGILHGIPYGVKDLLDFPDQPTTWGAEPYKDQVRNNTAAVIEKLEEAGAVLIVKLSLGALAMGDIWFGGTTKNPWNLDQGSSGSSAGPAAAVAAGLVPFSIGSETLGSIVSPSTRCAVTGLRPGFGRVSKYGAMALSWSMDKLGPICRNSEDCAIVFAHIAGEDYRDPSTVSGPFAYPELTDFSSIKIGYTKSLFEQEYTSKENDQAALDIMKKAKADLVEVTFPEEFPVNAMRIILTAEAAAAFNELTLSNQDSLLVNQGGWAWPNTFRTARTIPAVEYIQANRIRSELIEKVNGLLQKYDLIVCPSYGGKQLTMTNLTGHPALVIPLGHDGKGNNVSITLLANHFQEGLLCAAGQLLQEKLDLYTYRPSKFNK